MGRGSYTAADWSKLKNSRKLDSAKDETEIFLQTDMDPRFDPRFIVNREARDSEDHPESTPIIIGLDVTGSMGYLSHQIAKESLHETMMKLYSIVPVKDPAILFAAYGDYMDRAPLQVTQFESDIRIAEQLMDLWLENGGQSLVVPNLLWYFAAKHTLLDSIEKRGKKGFLFTIGDVADCRTGNFTKIIQHVFGEEVTLSTEEIVRQAGEKFEMFHIFLDDQYGKADGIVKLLPGRTISITRNDVDAIPEIIISTMQLAEGKERKGVVGQWTELKRPVVERALKGLNISTKGKGLIF